MSKVSKGDQVKDKDTAPKGVEAAKNDFGPAMVDAGVTNFEGMTGEPAKFVEPAKDPSPAKAEAAAAENANDADVLDAEFLDYVNGELAEEAKRLGYTVTVSRIEPEAPPKLHGPTMFYELTTGKGRVFSDLKDVPAGYVRYEEYLASKK